MKIILVILLVILFITILIYRYNKSRKQEVLFKNNLESASTDISLNVPFPFVELNQQKEIINYNKSFIDIFSLSEITGTSIKNLIPEYDENINKQRIIIKEHPFDIYTKISNVLKASEDSMYFLYFVDAAENEHLISRLENEKIVTGLIYIDNYDEAIDGTSESTRPLLNAMIARKLNTFASECGGITKKFEKDRYIFILTKSGLDILKEKKFNILEEIREISVGEHIPVTLSIGIGIDNKNIDSAMKSTKTAIDLALGRGGDQAVIKEGEKYLFFGGKSKEFSRNARIRTRVKADAISELIMEADKVFAIGHKQADLDCLGASVGICAIARSMGKNTAIILDEVSTGIKKLHKRLIETKDFENLFISSENALKSLTEKTLVIITDTHRYSLIENPEVIHQAKKVVLFDHHRMNTDFIEKAVLVYHEPYASSTCELVTEMIQYIGKTVKLQDIEADALLSGITIDTKNFCMKTGAITFETAAFLKRNGADSIRVKYLFQNDLAVYKAKANAVKDAEIYKEDMVISICPSNVENTSLTAAQAADELLNVSDIKASFVLCPVDDTIFISARSLGEINVQLILEKLGGGGHQTISGVQLKNISIENASDMLKKSINEYLQEVT